MRTSSTFWVSLRFLETNGLLTKIAGTAIARATEKANEIALQWGAPVNRDNPSMGGYLWATYKAICRRNGVFSNAQGPQNWNAQLIEPMLKEIASGWERTFSRRTPRIFVAFPTGAAQILQAFHADVENQAMQSGHAVAVTQVLSQHVSTYLGIFRDITTSVVAQVVDKAKDINREFQPAIAAAVFPAYATCAAERGMTHVQ
jgi:hypothetical protein